MIRPVNCIEVKRSSIDKKTGNCIGMINDLNIDELSDNSLNRLFNKVVHYKLLDDNYYTLINNMETYDFIRLKCIFGVDE